MVNNFYNDKDSTDINELAALNGEISDDMIEQLSQKLSQNMDGDSAIPPVNENDDSTLFEETQIPKPAITEQESEPNIASETEPTPSIETQAAEIATPIAEPKPEDAPQKEEIKVNKSFDDNFIKKYKAKLNKKAGIPDIYAEGEQPANTGLENSGESIENLSQGKISERPVTPELKDYNDSLDFLDGNVKYSKYVIYIDPQNVDFIEGLTVKERKNLINGILREQDDISITKQRFRLIETIIRHVVIALLTLSISIPLVYYAINASLEATIDNHRRSQTNWQALYKEHGKIHNN